MIMIRLIKHGDINHSIASLCSNKACGIDVLFAEHLLHASPKIHFKINFLLTTYLLNYLLTILNGKLCHASKNKFPEKVFIQLMMGLLSLL